MKYGSIEHFQTGVALPVSGLRSNQNCGIGEYTDLIPLGKWCSTVNFDLIQILPINDTGEEPSPYSALSAFALNPAYIHLPKLPGFLSIKTKYDVFKNSQKNQSNVQYKECYRFKKASLHQMFSHVFTQVSEDKTFLKWIEKHRWVKPYGVYCFLKEQNQLKSWQEWETHKTPSAATINNLWKKHWEKCLFFAWVQFEAEKQLISVSQILHGFGVRLKGDVPILLNEDSADVWAFRKYFNLSLRAGAPPDMFCATGQNWRFPSYNWQNLAKEDYLWWKERLQQASNYFHAFRIDHVLGFFRLWQIPEEQSSGLLGYLSPSTPITKTELTSANWSDLDIKIATKPLLVKQDIPEDLHTFFTKSEGDLYQMNFTRESEIFDLSIQEESKQLLLKLFWSRKLIQPDENKEEFYPYWFWNDDSNHNPLDVTKNNALHHIQSQHNQEELWAHNGKSLLNMINHATDMLVCAEDLGVVPDCVAPTLAELNILSLKIERWARNYNSDGSYIPMENYPRLSVCSPSCHDTSTLRGLWEEPDFNKAEYCQKINWQGEIPHQFTTEMAQAMVQENLKTNSLMCILPLQDWLSLYYNLRAPSPTEERINTPGTLDATNWSWKMFPNLEELSCYTEFNTHLKTMIHNRRVRNF